MRTLHVGLRVSDLERSLAFYSAVGYTIVGTVEGTAFGSLTMLRLPGDDFVAIELVHDPAKGKVDLGTGIDHLVIQVESLDAAATLPARGSWPSRLGVSTARKGRGPVGSLTRTATGSSWSSGRPAMPAASPRPTSPEPTHPAHQLFVDRDQEVPGPGPRNARLPTAWIRFGKRQADAHSSATTARGATHPNAQSAVDVRIEPHGAFGGRPCPGLCLCAPPRVEQLAESAWCRSAADRARRRDPRPVGPVWRGAGARLFEDLGAEPVSTLAAWSSSHVCGSTWLAVDVWRPERRQERRRQRQCGKLQQRQHVVVGSGLVQPEAAAVGTSVDQHPAALAADGDRDRLHTARAAGFPVPRHVAVEVLGPQAVGTVVAMGGTRRVERNVYAAVSTTKRTEKRQGW